MKCELGAICSRLSSGKSISAKLVSAEGKYPVYGGNGLRGYSNVSNFEGECAIIGRQGAFCGNVRYFKGAAYMTEHAIVVCADGKNDTRYLAYLLSLMELGRLSAQSAQPGLSVKTLSKQIVDVPLLKTQKRIAAILSSLDDKIENNKRINRHLEQMAQALFKSWFVDFTPFGGKMPKDWKSASLGDAFIFQRGVGITKNDVVPIRDSENPYVVYGAGREMFGYSKRFLLKEPSVLVAAIGAGAGTVSRSHEAKYSVTSNVFCVTVRNPYEYPYAIYALKCFDFIGRCSGSAQPMLAYGAFATDEILIPSEPVLRAFNELCAPLMRLVDLNLQNVTSLAYLRDMLLPRLMSGKIALVDTSIEQ